MPGLFRPSPVNSRCIPFLLLLGLFGCSASQPPTRPAAPVAPVRAPAPAPAKPAFVSAPIVYPVMLGIDVLESQGFAAVKGKKIGLLTHPAAVNRLGVTTVDVLRRAPGVQLVRLFGVEHGVNNEFPAGKNYENYTDKRTGLPVMSLYDGKTRKPTKAQLKGLDAVVIDLQDIGSRSYTFISAMKLALEACFENNIEVIVLDRPNPLGGLKVDGPLLDAKRVSYVGAFRVPYVHGLTIAELARMAKEAPGVLAVPDAVRIRGQLTVVPMRGWRRAMRWPDTGLTWIPTSPMMPDYGAVMGYPMTGLGCELGGFRHGVGASYIFRGISHKTVKLDVVEKEIRALNLPGLQFRRVSAPNPKTGKPATGLYIEISDFDDWHPTELSINLMRLACKLEPKNPFATATAKEADFFLKIMGSEEFFNALKRDGARTDVNAFLKKWAAEGAIYQKQSQRYWLYR
ncbi:MAG: DUF1343 domain-containing protein [Verrucomicrobia bacterium]|nr:DUF1343 domain-containing protein [Verrucomicrobiota bacterium]